ncbi:ATP-binding protein [Mucilaginibacter angelicae]|uniref:ATP-binding protein n=1 Tax=Mucilaginibacter angelicae TaxID=869718 RepID=A0ABV6L2P9_9SPHI
MKIIDNGPPLLKGIVYDAVSVFSEILTANNLYFFEEYTDHGINHINLVLKASAELITEDTFEFLSSEDITVLIIAVLLHDLGMHLQPLTLLKMIEGGYDDIRLEHLDNQTWSTLWNQFLQNAKKMNASERLKLFGKETVVIQNPTIEAPDQMSGTDRKLIGEFIRLNHPRIAHELALKGFYTNNKQFQQIISDKTPSHLVDLTGLLARSHGMNIRDTFQHLELFCGKTYKRPFGLHLIFLMIVLRLSDYFQIDAKRVSYIYFISKYFSTPFSLEEHNKHLQIIHLQQLDDDPETYYANATPTNSKYFLSLKKLFEAIQNEIDLCWAIHGEIYGLVRSEVPRIKIRRFQSNILSKEYAKRAAFVPEEMSFSLDRYVAALLAGPLYGHNLSCAVRELLQNSVDACLERELYETKRHNPYESVIKSEIFIQKEKYFLRITDNGKGMSLFEIKKYFLRVGASFRNSTEWRIEFLDDNGHYVLPRIGKFGIGILSAFLLGEEITVQTQSMFENSGYQFSTRNTDEQIEVLPFRQSEPGTTIIIPITNQKYKRLIKVESNEIPIDEWYYLEAPKIVFKFPEHKTSRVSIKHIPSMYDAKSSKWSKISINDYPAIFWSFNFLNGQHKAFFCNGIFVPNSSIAYNIDEFFTRKICISVFDTEGNLPLSIDRNSLTRDPGFEEIIKEDLFLDVLAELLSLDVVAEFVDGECNITASEFIHPAFEGIGGHRDYSNGWDDITQVVYHESGFTLNHSCFLKNIGVRNYLYIIKSLNKTEDLNLTIKSLPKDVLICISKGGENKVKKRLLSIEDQSDVSFFLKKEDQMLSNVWRGRGHSEYLQNFAIVNNGRRRKMQQSFFATNKDDIDFAVLSDVKIHDFPNIVFYERLIKKYLGDDIFIPYSKYERAKKFPYAFDQLNHRINDKKK